METRIYIVDYPQMSWPEARTWLKDENIRQPKIDELGYYYVAGELGKMTGMFLLAEGWKFQVERVEV